MVKFGLKNAFQSQIRGAPARLAKVAFRKLKTTQEKQKQIINFPPVLAVHLNRVVYDRWGGSVKLDNLVRFPSKFKFSERRKGTNFQTRATRSTNSEARCATTAAPTRATM